MSSLLTTDLPQLPAEVWQQIFLLLPSLEDVFHTSVVCRLFRSLIHKDWFLKEYQSKHRLHTNQSLQVWLKFSDKLDLYRNFIADERTIARNAKGVFDEVDTVFYVGDQFFDHKSCLVHAGSTISVHYVLEESDIKEWTLSFWLSMSSEGYWKIFTLDLLCSPAYEWTMAFDFETSLIKILENKVQRIVEDFGEIQLDQWVHIAVVIASESAAAIQLYINGKPVVRCSIRHMSLKEVAIANPSYYGSLADLCLWSRRLLPIEIRAIAEQKTSIDLVHVFERLIERQNCETSL